MTRVSGKSPANGGVEAEKRARAAQSRAEKAKTGDTITWKGATFRLEPGELPGVAQLLLTQMAAADLTSRDPASEDAARQLLELLLAQPSGIPPGEEGFDPDGWDPGDYKAFMRHAAKTRAPIGDIMDAVKDIVEILAARPTLPPPGSLNGRPEITANLTGTFSDAADVG